jgi:hypothetical protein
MSAHRHINRAHRNARSRGESSALRRLAEILERNATLPPVVIPQALPQYTMRQFTSCNPPKYVGGEGATALLQWLEAMENTFIVSDCPDYLHVKYATSALTERALTWWNGQKIIYGMLEAYELSWDEFKGLILAEFCPISETVKLEEEFHGLKQLGGDHFSYTTRFHELSLLVPHQVTPEFRAVSKYIQGLPIEVENFVTATQPATLSAAIRMAASISENCIKAGTLSVTKKNNKRETSVEPKTENPKSKKTKTTKNYSVTTPTPQTTPSYSYSTQPQSTQPQSNTPYQPKKKYTGPYPLCNNCNYHHPTHTSCRLCTSCNRLGHYAISCRTNPTPIYSVAPALPIANTQPARGCFNCGDLSHFKNACPNLRVAPAPKSGNNRVFALTTKQTPVRPHNQLTAPTAPIPQHDQNDLPFVQRPGKAPEGTSVPRSDQAPDFYDYVMNS